MPYAYKQPDYVAEAAALYLGGAGTVALAKQFGCAPSGMWGHLKKFGVELRPRQKHSYDHSFFDSIDSESKAYFLGLLYADGSNNESSYSVELALAESDLDILQSFKKAIRYTGEIKLRHHNPKDAQRHFRMTLCGKALCATLARIGCGQRKSKTLVYPSVPAELDRHFIRGYFDGDGSVYLAKFKPSHTRQCNIAMISTESFCKSIAEKINAATGMQGKFRKAGNCDMWYVAYAGNGRGRAIRSYFYDDATVFGGRKHSLLSLLPDHPIVGARRRGHQPAY